MNKDYQGQPIYIKGFVPPLTVNKLFAGFDGQPEGKAYDEYTVFVNYVLSKFGDFEPNEPIEGFDVRDGIPSPEPIKGADGNIQPKLPQSSISDDALNFHRLQSENAALKASNENLLKVGVQSKENYESFIWAMVALAALVVAGFFGFGDF